MEVTHQLCSISSSYLSCYAICSDLHCSFHSCVSSKSLQFYSCLTSDCSNPSLSWTCYHSEQHFDLKSGRCTVFASSTNFELVAFHHCLVLGYYTAFESPKYSLQGAANLRDPSLLSAIDVEEHCSTARPYETAAQ